MNLQILSHASLAVRAAGVTLLVDPWLVGSCYWRSWWNYPPVDPALVDGLQPDAIYLTHVHWDHFHGATLKKFSRDTRIYIPYERSPRVLRDLGRLSFKNVRELDHGEGVNLASDFRITSYQFSSPWGDSALMIEADGITLFDANDCKLMGAPLRQILKRHGPVDFAFRSHSSANDRICTQYTDDDEVYAEDPAQYIESFMNFMNKVQPKYAIPFASNHCHLHRDVYHLNSFVMTPFQVKERIDGHGGLKASELKIMLSGDEWDSEQGFRIAEHTWFSNRPAHLERYRAEVAGKLEETYAKEDKADVRLLDFERFFRKFFAAVPGFRKRALHGKPLAFCAIAGIGRKWFLADMQTESVSETDEQDIPEDCIIYEAPAAILRHALAANMFSHAGISKRVVYRCRKIDAPYLAQWKQLLAAYEYDAIPLSQLFSWRTFRSYWPRWREILLYLYVKREQRAGKTLREIETELLS